jgi:hypothetical protein
MPTITICIGAHGSTTAVRTRSGDDIRYPLDFNLNFLSIAGRANIQTQVGLLFKRENKEEQAKLISDIQKYDTYSLLRDDVPIRLGGLGTDYVTLSYLVPNIFVRHGTIRTINDQDESLKVMEEMEPEMRALAMLADIKYSKSSPPEIFKNEQIKKMYALMYHGFENKTAIDIICLSDKEIPYAFDLLFKYKITDSDMSTILVNKVDNMFQRMVYICEKINDDNDDIWMAYQMVKDNNDTDDIIMKTLGFMKNGMKSIDAYYESIKF